MIKTVIFDMDGVIVDSEKLWHKRFHTFLLSYGIEVEETSLYKLIGIGPQEKTPVWKEILEGIEVPFPIEETLSYMNARFPITDIDYAPVLNPNIHTLLHTLRKQGIQTAIASSAPPHLIQIMIDQCNLENEFDLVVSGSQFHENKPHPEIYLHTAEQLGTLPENCLVIEDSPVGIEAGKNAGMCVIAKEDDTFGMDQSQADYLINDLIQVLDILANL